MRIALKDINTTKRYTAIFNKFSLDKKNKSELTILITDVRSSNEQVTDHVWMRIEEINSSTLNYMKKSLKEGCIISFKADVKEYYKRRNGKVIKDYCFNNVRHVNIIKKIGG